MILTRPATRLLRGDRSCSSNSFRSTTNSNNNNSGLMICKSQSSVVRAAAGSFGQSCRNDASVCFSRSSWTFSNSRRSISSYRSPGSGWSSCSSSIRSSSERLFSTAAAAGGNTGSTGSGKLKVVLDIDECLVHTTFDEEHVELRQQEYRPDTVNSIEQFQITMSDGTTARVNKRPGLDDFLQSVLSEFETYTFTAAAEIYASPLLDSLDTQNRLKGRFYRQHCTNHKGNYLKDISMVDSRDMSRIVLVDNNPISFLLQPDNGIPVISFYDQEHDPTLEAVLELLRFLDEEEDVRPHLIERFSLRKHLEPLSKDVFV